MRPRIVMAAAFVVMGAISYFLNELGILAYPPGNGGGTRWNVGFILCTVFIALAIWLILRDTRSTRSRSSVA